jgi:EAL domain-containing protein (putative c-di-GMP-specific phosphodiesterase class I)
MYERKKAQRGSIVMHRMTESASAERDSLMRSLRSAVKQKPWTLHYQPSVELASGKITSVEALLRWRRTEGGFVPPGEFLPLAEEMGLIEIIGEWVFEEICRQHGEWMKQGVLIPIGFNLSLRQLWQKDLVQRLSVGLRSSGMDPKNIIIEVSESTAMMDPVRAQAVLVGLSEEGFQIAIDDFGAGYTPPENIRGLPVDILKIDQPLIREIPDDKEVASFIESVVAFSVDLGCRAHAEGVETEEQRSFLVARGCGAGQGYLFSRPLPADEITQLFHRGDGFIILG